MNRKLYEHIIADEDVQELCELNWKGALATAGLAATMAMGSPTTPGINPAQAATTQTTNIQQQQTIGQKNNNPLNLKAFQNWDGMTGKDKYGHAIFSDLEHGIRACLKNLINHFRNNPEETLDHYMNSFAEKNGSAEATFVAKELGISSNNKLKTINPVDMLVSLAKIESKTNLDKNQVVQVKTKYGL